MSHYHILDLAPKQDRARVAFHIPVPDVNNSASVSYRTALAQWQEERSESGAIESVVPELDTAAHGLDDGSVYEHVETVLFSGNLSIPDKKTAIENAYSARQADLLTAAQAILEFWGWSGDIT